jgi:hypothetical protein
MKHMKMTLMLMIAAASLFGQEATKKKGDSAAEASSGLTLPRDLALEAQLLSAQEKEAADKANALLKLVFDPINARKQELLVKACAAANIADVNGLPGCEIRSGRVFPTRQMPAAGTVGEGSVKK